MEIWIVSWVTGEYSNVTDVTEGIEKVFDSKEKGEKFCKEENAKPMNWMNTGAVFRLHGPYKVE